MSYDQHLFISYAHIDDQPVSEKQDGWITRFHKSLSAILSMRIGGRAKIWRDDSLQGNEVFADEITDQFAKTAVLVSIISPRYLYSKWCYREISEFCKVAEESGGVKIGNKTRIFKILKEPVESEEVLPSIAQEITGYEFFVLEDNVPLELDAAYGDKYGQDYNRKVGKLAWEIAQLLKDLGIGPSRTARELADDQPIPEPESGSESPPSPAEGKKVYLAECARDCRENREIIEGDLKRHGFTVLPDSYLPRDEDDYVAAVEGMLEQCALSIHLLGSQYGAIPDGDSQKSIVELQNQAAVRQSKAGSLDRIIWLPDGTQSELEQQQAFIEAMHHDEELQYGADLITGDLERLKLSIHEMLRRTLQSDREQSNEQVRQEDAPRLVYVICNERDRKATVPLRKFLRSQGFEATIPAFEGDATAVRKAHQDLLANCDAVILFYGSGDEAWKRSNYAELIKMAGYRRGKLVHASFTYLSEPRTSDKDDLIDLEEPNLINGLGGFAEDAMEGFLEAIDAKAS